MADAEAAIFAPATGLVAAAHSYARSLTWNGDEAADDLLQQALLQTLASGRILEPALVRTALRTTFIDETRRYQGHQRHEPGPHRL